jgi:uncharacterized protein (TIGR03083 family)
MIAAERLALADLLEGLSDDQWETPSLCAGWTVHDAAAHITLQVLRSPSVMAKSFVASGFRIPGTIDRMTRERAQAPRSQIIALLRDRATERLAPPGAGPGAPLTDVVVHGLDIREPLGIDWRPADDRLLGMLRFLTTGRTTGFLPRGRLRGLRLEATDLDWSHGTGALVRGPATSLGQAATGRRVALPRLEGDGVALLGSRV